MRKIILFIVLFAISSVAQISYAAATEQVGSDSANRFPTVAQPDWPKGIVEIPRHESRVYSIWVNGNENFYFKTTAEQINELISLFSKARMRDHELWISTTKKQVKSFNGDSIDYNVNLQILSGIALAMSRREGNPDTFEPRLTVYTDNNHTLVKQLKLPDNIVLNCDIKEFPLKGKSVKPNRKSWYGIVQFEDSTPATDFEHGLSTQITLWEKGVEGGIKIAKVDHKCFFDAAFSDKEIADLKAGNSWLTITVGNWLTEAKEDHTRLPVELLSLEKENLKPVRISRPKFYYGRILFEDGSAPILNPPPWPGAEIRVDFPYAGDATIDSQGHFTVYFTKEQYEEAKAQKVRENIYIPDYSEKGRSTARFAFPVALLSQDKTKAGVVKIPRPKLPRQELATAESKIGKSIPGFDNIRFDVFQEEQAKNKPLLVCFWHIDQRPSRQCILILKKQKDVLQDKNIVILAVHSGTKPEKEVREWLKENGLSLMSGTIEGDPYDTLLAWGAKGLPWLILTDEQHIITNAGFSLADLSIMH